jgi:hypothetical protein
VVTPETVVRWHRAGFRLYWSLISKVRRAGKEEAVQGGPASDLPNSGGEPTWGAPRIHGELLMLGFDVSERTISRWMKRAPKDPETARRWLTLLHNPIADKLGIPRKLVTFQVMRRTLGTDMQGHGTMKDVQQILRHASIKTTAEIYMQEIPASVRSAINSRTRAIFSQRKRHWSRLEKTVFYPRRRNSFKPQNTTVPNGSKFASGNWQVLERNGSSGRTRTYNPPVNSRVLCH